MGTQALHNFAWPGIASMRVGMMIGVHGHQGMGRMNVRTLIIAACVVLPVTVLAQASSPAAGTDATAATSSPKTKSAPIEELGASEEAGQTAIAYVVRWHGTRVLVEDALAKSRLSARESANFFASHHDGG